ncbi:protein tramtrack, beta isoform isoform X1 [Microplitis demolitor]|uniref:protein tramtrack, beta isoform isoform X1 n=1 Tax=Microplitis demolitor TaxID=69319 RepID=UPI0004CD9CA7|nr:protein tramtrack, beta isoform isoform X1 [Microplitis demolitor]XP_053594293.1 protein tramtrack, beta isoform isoform X1 [Microplitis demolitor]
MEDDQQFCLRWNNHQTTLIQNFDTLLESGTLVDCTLAAEGKYLKAHKVVLSACSPYFEGLLSEHYDKHPVFILKDVKFKELKAMMDYMYRGEVNISQDQLAALLKAAESLQIKGLSESKTGGSGSTSGSSKAETRSQKTAAPQPTAPSLDIPHPSSGLTIEKNSKVPRQSLAQTSVGDLPEDSASPSLSKGISSREGSVSPNGRKRKRYRRRSLNDDNPIDNHETSNSSDMSHQPMNVPALGVAPVADEKSMSESADSLGRSALMQQLTKPADEMLQMPVEKPEPNDTLIEPKSEYLEDPEESVEDLTLDDDLNDMNDLEPDNNRAGPSHDSSHPGIASWHVTGDRSNAGGVVGSVAGAPGSNDEVFMAAQEAANAHRDSQDCKPAVTIFKIKKEPQEFTEECSQEIFSTIKIESVQYACPNINCNRVFDKRKSRNTHFSVHCRHRHYEETCIRIGDVKYACSNENCDRVFTSKDSRYIHTKYHCGKPPRFKCPHCNYRSLKKQNIQAHAKRLHFDDDTRVIELYKASTSGAEGQDANDSFEAFETFPMLEIIPKIEPDLIDVKPQPQQLDIKPRIRVKSNIEIKSEINVSTVSGVGIFSCPNLNCGRTFKNIASRNRHLKKICNQKPNFKCSRCEFKALLRETVEDHAKKMHRRCKTSVIGLINPVAGELICPNENCQKVYASRKRLEHHVKYDCKKLLPRFKCYYCQFKAFFKSQVKKHVIRNHPSLECRLINLISDD